MEGVWLELGWSVRTRSQLAMWGMLVTMAIRHGAPGWAFLVVTLILVDNIRGEDKSDRKFRKPVLNGYPEGYHWQDWHWDGSAKAVRPSLDTQEHMSVIRYLRSAFATWWRAGIHLRNLKRQVQPYDTKSEGKPLADLVFTAFRRTPSTEDYAKIIQRSVYQG